MQEWIVSSQYRCCMYKTPKKITYHSRHNLKEYFHAYIHYFKAHSMNVVCKYCNLICSYPLVVILIYRLHMMEDMVSPFCMLPKMSSVKCQGNLSYSMILLQRVKVGPKSWTCYSKDSVLFAASGL